MPLQEKWIDELSAVANQSLDKLRTTVISLSGGALGTTILFLKDIVAPNTAKSLWYVKISWLLWLLSIVTCLVSYFAQYQAALQERRGIVYETHNPFAAGWYRAMHFLYLTGIASFIVGVGFTAAFVLRNI